MKRFILSDLHIGYPTSQYEVMGHAIRFIRENAGKGDRVLGLGDWWHIQEKGVDFCLSHPMTARFRELAEQIEISFTPGNHDAYLEQFVGKPQEGNPVSPIQLIPPFSEKGLVYCHGHEYDPVVNHASWLERLWAFIKPKSTPSRLKKKAPTMYYLMAVNFIHTRAVLDLKKEGGAGGKSFKGIVMGHTHLPVIENAPELPLLMNDGDMRDSGTFILQEDDRFYLMRWENGRWNVAASHRVQPA